MHQQLILSFFTSFSRFEYALKAAGKAREGASGNAEADWREVETALRKMEAAQTARIKEVAGILLTAPPRKQVLRDGRLEWRQAGSAGDDAQNLVASLKRVRNNLFHGGKYYPASVDLSARSAELVRCAQGVLEELLRLPSLKNVADQFHGYDPHEG